MINDDFLHDDTGAVPAAVERLIATGTALEDAEQEAASYRKAARAEARRCIRHTVPPYSYICGWSDEQRTLLEQVYADIDRRCEAHVATLSETAARGEAEVLGLAFRALGNILVEHSTHRPA